MKLQLRKHSLIILVTMALTSCGEDRPAGLVITASAQPATIALNPIDRFLNFVIAQAYALVPTGLKDSNDVEVTVETAWITLTKIKFKTASEDEATDDSEESADTSYHYKGSYFIDLLDDTPSPLADGEAPTSAIRRIEMKLHKSTSAAELPESAPSELNGKSIVLKGHVNGHAFSFIADETTVFKAEAPVDVTGESGKNFSVALGFASMFSKIDLSEISSAMDISSTNRGVAGDKCPEIANNADLYTCFRKGLELSTNLGVDSSQE